MSRTKKETPVFSSGRFRLRLFVAGNEYNSVLARRNLQDFCKEHFGGECTWEEIDILEDSAVALKENILVTPTLEVRTDGAETRMLVFGNLTDRERLAAIMPRET